MTLTSNGGERSLQSSVRGGFSRVLCFGAAMTRRCSSYDDFLTNKTRIGEGTGFEPLWIPDFLFDFQKALVDWSLRRGRSAIFADCGLGKTPIALVWAQNVFRKTGLPVLILTPLSVSHQFVREGEKFGLVVRKSNGRVIGKPITVTNYQQLHHFRPSDWGGIVCDESSILKNFDGSLRRQITDFMSKIQYRILCTATAAPNDYIELGTSSEALGELRRVEMMSQFFNHDGGDTSKWRLKKHAAKHIFWRWVSTWARAVRKPSDVGGSNNGFQLPKLTTVEHIVRATTPNPDWLFDMPAIGLTEQRTERRRTIDERCEKAADLVANTRKPAVCWCHLNDEGHLLEKLIPGAVEVEGSDADEFKEEAFESFEKGETRVIISKPTIAGFGLNWQHCAHQTFFPSHSFEQWYQAIRRCWRFGQKMPVTVDVISSEGESGVISNMKRKSDQAAVMFQRLVELINTELQIEHLDPHQQKAKLPSWL